MALIRLISAPRRKQVDRLTGSIAKSYISSHCGSCGRYCTTQKTRNDPAVLFFDVHVRTTSKIRPMIAYRLPFCQLTDWKRLTSCATHLFIHLFSFQNTSLTKRFRHIFFCRATNIITLLTLGKLDFLLHSRNSPSKYPTPLSTDMPEAVLCWGEEFQ